MIGQAGVELGHRLLGRPRVLPNRGSPKRTLSKQTRTCRTGDCSSTRQRRRSWYRMGSHPCQRPSWCSCRAFLPSSQPRRGRCQPGPQLRLSRRVLPHRRRSRHRRRSHCHPWRCRRSRCRRRSPQADLHHRVLLRAHRRYPTWQSSPNRRTKQRRRPTTARPVHPRDQRHPTILIFDPLQTSWRRETSRPIAERN